MDCNLPGSSVHGIFQARIQEWVDIPTPEDLPNPGIKPMSPLSPALQCILNHWATWEAPVVDLTDLKNNANTCR